MFFLTFVLSKCILKLQILFIGDRHEKKVSRSCFAMHCAVGFGTADRLCFLQLCGGIVKNNTPEAVEESFRMAKAYLDARPDRAPLVTVNSGNEWTETSYLQPDDIYGYGYLEAIRRVFLEE